MNSLTQEKIDKYVLLSKKTLQQRINILNAIYERGFATFEDISLFYQLILLGWKYMITPAYELGIFSNSPNYIIQRIIDRYIDGIIPLYSSYEEWREIEHSLEGHTHGIYLDELIELNKYILTNYSSNMPYGEPNMEQFKGSKLIDGKYYQEMELSGHIRYEMFEPLADFCEKNGYIFDLIENTEYDSGTETFEIDYGDEGIINSKNIPHLSEILNRIQEVRLNCVCIFIQDPIHERRDLFAKLNNFFEKYYKNLINEEMREKILIQKFSELL